MKLSLLVLLSLGVLTLINDGSGCGRPNNDPCPYTGVLRMKRAIYNRNSPEYRFFDKALRFIGNAFVNCQVHEAFLNAYRRRVRGRLDWESVSNRGYVATVEWIGSKLVKAINNRRQESEVNEILDLARQVINKRNNDLSNPNRNLNLDAGHRATLQVWTSMYDKVQNHFNDICYCWW